MNKYDIQLTLTKDEQIVINFVNPIKKIDCCYEAPIYFVQKNTRHLLSTETIKDTLTDFCIILKQALNNNLQLDVSINKDIGYMYITYIFYLNNNDYVGSGNLVFEKNTEVKSWIGERYHAFGNCEALCWIYNNQNSEIIFELTPQFDNEYILGDETPNYIEYKKWIKNYKPLLKRIIPKEIAQQWLKQATMILDQIEKNAEQFKSDLEEL